MHVDSPGMGATRGQRYISRLYVGFAAATGLVAVIAPLWILLLWGRTSVTLIAGLVLLATGLRAMWVSLRAGIWIDPDGRTVTVRGYFRTTSLVRPEIASLSIEYQCQTDKWPRGYFEPHFIPLRGVSVRHRHSPGQWGHPCRECLQQRAALRDVGAALGIPVTDRLASAS
jgi:hypothetical protein